MGDNRASIVPFAWLADLGAMIDARARIQVECDKCGRYKRLSQDELIALAAKVGRSYSLHNRRCRCHLTKGCEGWNRFFYLHGVYRPLWDEKTWMRWFMARP